jgi:hypothetical protein
MMENESDPATKAIASAQPAIWLASSAFCFPSSPDMVAVVAIPSALKTYEENEKITLVGPSAASCTVPANWKTRSSERRCGIFATKALLHGRMLDGCMPAASAKSHS